MKERPILFSAPTVRAILDGRKTQARCIARDAKRPDFGNVYTPGALAHQSQLTIERACPYGQFGDRLWVRETHAQVFEVDIPRGRARGPLGTTGTPARPDWKSRYVYLADGEMPNVQWHHVGDSQPVRWTPSIHMPRAASRITLEITGVRFELLQGISEQDAIAEGIGKTPSGFWSTYGQREVDGTFSPRSSFQSMWESINGPMSWEANPWVWVIEFKRIEGEKS